MTGPNPHLDPAHRERFVWRQDELDEAFQAGSQARCNALATGDGQLVEVASLGHGRVRLTIHLSAHVAELTLSADEARWLAGQMQRSERPSPAG